LVFFPFQSDLISFCANGTSRFFRINLINQVSCFGYFIQSKDTTHIRRIELFNFLTSLIFYSTDSPMSGTTNDNISFLNCSFLHQNSSYRAHTRVFFSFQNYTGSGHFFSGFEFHHFCHYKNQLYEIQDAFSSHYRGSTPGHISTILFQHNAIIQKLSNDSIHISIRQIYFIDSDNDRNACRFSMINSFFSLRFHPFISGNYNDRYIGNIGTPSSHCRKSFMSRSIKESNFIFINLNLISSNMLSDTTCFTCHYIGIAYIIQNRSFTMVYMTHNGHNWRTRFIFCISI